MGEGALFVFEEGLAGGMDEDGGFEVFRREEVVVRTRNVGLHAALCCSSHDWRSCVCAREEKRVGWPPPTPARPRQRDRDIIVVVF